MPGLLTKAALVSLVLVVAASASAHRYRRHRPRAAEPAPAALSIDKRDRLVAVPGPFKERPYWLALAQCGGIYFKLNTLYADAAVQARVVTPNVRVNQEFTRKLNEAISIATAFFDAAQRFLMTDRDIGRDAAILTYDGASRAAGERLSTIERGLAAVRACPALYRACRRAYARACSEPLPSLH
jgi:hypothetical protein